MIAAIITAYKPDADFTSRFTPLLSVCGSIIVSDNTPGGHSSFNLPAGFTVIHNFQNVGLAPALNVGITEAIRQGYKYAILFDQDSTPSPDFVSRMVAKLFEATEVHGLRCCVGPKHLDDGVMDNKTVAATKWSEESSQSVWEDVTCLPTSGMTFALGALTDDESFSDEFFLDLVDFEWCWRLRGRGWRFLRSVDVEMYHRLGVEERRFLGMTFHVPAPYRHYFQVRDSLRLAGKPYVPFYSKFRLIGILPLKALVYPFILDRGYERLTWMVKGFLDYLSKIRGIGAAAKKLSR